MIRKRMGILGFCWLSLKFGFCWIGLLFCVLMSHKNEEWMGLLGFLLGAHDFTIFQLEFYKFIGFCVLHFYHFGFGSVK